MQVEADLWKPWGKCLPILFPKIDIVQIGCMRNTYRIRYKLEEGIHTHSHMHARIHAHRHIHTHFTANILIYYFNTKFHTSFGTCPSSEVSKALGLLQKRSLFGSVHSSKVQDDSTISCSY